MSEYMQTILWNGREMVVPVPFDLNAALLAEKQQLEQQIAVLQTLRSEYQLCIQQRDAVEQRLEEAQALLKDLTERDTAVEGECWCVFCDATDRKVSFTQDELGRDTWTVEVSHEESCIITQARAFLAQHPKE